MPTGELKAHLQRLLQIPSHAQQLPGLDPRKIKHGYNNGHCMVINNGYLVVIIMFFHGYDSGLAVWLPFFIFPEN